MNYGAEGGGMKEGKTLFAMDPWYVFDECRSAEEYERIFGDIRGGEGNETPVEPNTMIFLDVNSPLYSHYYKGEYIDDCMIFESDEDIRLPVNKPVYIGSAVDVSAHMKLIYEAHIRGDEIAGCLLINAMFSQIAGIIAKSESSGMPHADKLIPLRYDLCAHPERDWSIRSMSEILYVSETYF